MKSNNDYTKLEKLNLGMIIVATLLFAYTFLVTYEVFRDYNQLQDTTEQQVKAMNQARSLNDASLSLTENARLYVMTQNAVYFRQYFYLANIKQEREKALSELYNLSDSESMLHLSKALSESNELMIREMYAMKLIHGAMNIDMQVQDKRFNRIRIFEDDAKLSQKDKIDFAQGMLFDAVYEDYRTTINSEAELAANTILNRAEFKRISSTIKLENSLKRLGLLLITLFFISVMIFVVIGKTVIIPLKSYIKDIQAKKLLEVSGCQELRFLGYTYNFIFEQNQANERRLINKADHDSLTGVFNRGYFQEAQQHYANALNFALIILDIDFFKQVNDTYGHEVGDKILKSVSAKLEHLFRSETDSIYRIGGDEFAIIMTSMDPTLKHVIIDKVNVLNEQLAKPTEDLPPVALSVGVAFAGKETLGDFQLLFNRADQALYKVKETGRNGCSFYEA